MEQIVTPVEIRPLEHLSAIFWQAKGIERVLSENKGVLKAAEHALLSLENELRPFAPQPINPSKRTDMEKEAYSIVKTKIDDIRRFVRLTLKGLPKYPGIGAILQKYRLQISDAEVDQLAKGIPISPRRKSYLPAAQAMALCQALGIARPIYNQSFETQKVGTIQPYHLHAHKQGKAPAIFTELDEKYNIHSAKCWTDGYTAKSKRKTGPM